MPYRLRQIELDDKMCQQVSLDVLEPIYPRTVICEQLSVHRAWEERERCLNMLVMIYLLLAAALWTRLSFPRVLEKLARPLHVLGLPLSAVRVVASAITYRRQQLGSAPLQGLFAHCCRPLCSKETPGAYRFGRRLVAIDGTRQDVADTPANARSVRSRYRHTEGSAGLRIDRELTYELAVGRAKRTLSGGVRGGRRRL